MTLKEKHIHFVEWEYNHKASDAPKSAIDWRLECLPTQWNIGKYKFNHMGQSIAPECRAVMVFGTVGLGVDKFLNPIGEFNILFGNELNFIAVSQKH
jgi:hypothetical protein